MPRASGDTLAPSATSDLAVEDRTPTSLTVSWTAASDSGGSGLARYALTVDGRVVQTVEVPTTSVSLTDLSADTSYDVGVTAFDGANNESDTVVRSVTTAAESGDGDETDSGGTAGGSDGDSGDTGSEGDGNWWGSGSDGDGSGSDSGGGWWGTGSGAGSDGDGGWLGSGDGDTTGDGGWW